MIFEAGILYNPNILVKFASCTSTHVGIFWAVLFFSNIFYTLRTTNISHRIWYSSLLYGHAVTGILIDFKVNWIYTYKLHLPHQILLSARDSGKGRWSAPRLPVRGCPKRHYWDWLYRSIRALACTCLVQKAVTRRFSAAATGAADHNFVRWKVKSGPWQFGLACHQPLCRGGDIKDGCAPIAQVVTIRMDFLLTITWYVQDCKDNYFIRGNSVVSFPVVYFCIYCLYSQV